MARDHEARGSLYDIGKLINEYPDTFKSHLVLSGLPEHYQIEWVSPKRDDEMREYRDQKFLESIRVDQRVKYPLDQFWPKKGPQWDGLGIAGGDTIVLVEAKANLPEMVTSGTQAKGDSLLKIEGAMHAVSVYLNIKSKANWTQTFYQYTNRICYLYYLRQLNNIPAYLVNVYFIGDKSVNGPETVEEWRGAITVMKEYLGINKRHKLSKYMVDVFVHVDEIGGHAKII